MTATVNHVNHAPVLTRLTLTQVLDRLDTDILGFLDWPDTRRALNAPEPPVTHHALTEALCLGDSASEHPVYDVLDVWMSFHRDLALLLGAQIGAAMATSDRGLRLLDYQCAWQEAADLHKDVLRRRQELVEQSVTKVDDCEPWCTHMPPARDRHDDGFHHTGAWTKLATSEGPGREAGEVKLNLQRYAPGEDNPEQYPVCVVVDWPANAGFECVSELTLDEADALGRALLLKVADARAGSAQ